MCEIQQRQTVFESG